MAKRAPRSTAKLNSLAGGAGPSGVEGPEGISGAIAQPDPDPAGDGVQTPGAATAGSSSGHPTDEDIRARAYERYLERGGGHGLDFDDWVQAERELGRKR
jgi:hypothetical protein